MGKFKNSADDRVSLVAIVRTMPSDGKRVPEIMREIKMPRAAVATRIRRNNLGIPPFDGTTPSEQFEARRRLVRSSSEFVA